MMEAIPIAKGMNYTLVVPPFHRHPRMELFVEDPNNAEEKENCSQKYIENFEKSF